MLLERAVALKKTSACVRLDFVREFLPTSERHCSAATMLGYKFSHRHPPLRARVKYRFVAPHALCAILPAATPLVRLLKNWRSCAWAKSPA